MEEESYWVPDNMSTTSLDSCQDSLAIVTRCSIGEERAAKYQLLNYLSGLLGSYPNYKNYYVLYFPYY